MAEGLSALPGSGPPNDSGDGWGLLVGSIRLPAAILGESGQILAGNDDWLELAANAELATPRARSSGLERVFLTIPVGNGGIRLAIAPSGGGQGDQQRQLSERDSDIDSQLTLTPRETEVCQLLAEGCSGPDVAHRLGISAATVQAHIRNALTRNTVATRTGLVALAVSEGIVAIRPRGRTS